MRKILWLSHEVDLGGANKCLAEQIQILYKAGYHVEVIVLRKGSFAAHIEPYVKGIHEVYFYSWVLDLGKKISPFVFWKRVLRNVAAALQIWWLLLKLRPDYVATNTTTIPAAALASRLAFRKHIWFLHEFGEEDHGYQMFCGFKRGARLINWLSQKVVFNSEAVRRKYASIVPPSKQFIAHNPVILPEGTEAVALSGKNRPDELQCVILGQIAPSKNQLEALEAIRLLRDDGVHIRLKIAGNIVNEQYHVAIKEFIVLHRLEDNVDLLQYTERPLDLLRAADFYLMCSRMEAFGRVSVEALKLGVPVIAADSGGSPEIVKDGVNGYLYQPGKATDLAQKMLRFGVERELFDRREIARDARLAFNEQRTLQQLKDIFV